LDIVLYIELPANRIAGSLYGTKRARYRACLLGIRPRKEETDPVAGSKVLLLAMIRQGYSQISALLPPGKGTPHLSYYKRGSVVEYIPVTVRADWMRLPYR
jgi:hypothetical protein